ncbi:structural maintenance of chromosomes flexible hinge domain-containing protein 1-like [Physella acuta]|uniref:structural maintenance of chromosomes flexible hinge domain-containing protein 1-like n=1 Tax=Physella acuta TaxID=109671 RepID=UPI0027DB5F98|nr:structural maintenance of chromosomes flexible hinge domain-containing protein 1-like [Physella acuta]
MAAPSTQEDENLEVFIYDRRTDAAPEVKLSLSGVLTFKDFKARVKEVLNLDTDDFIIATTSREEIKNDDTFEYIERGDTLYILNEINQELCAPAHERVDYLPHYDTIVKGGMYEYYASEGQNPLPFAFAELIDNSLAATAFNDGSRKIELRLYVDDASVKNCVVVIDNGKGMTPRQLNNWAIYRLSKFTRRDKRGKGKKPGKGGDIDLTSRNPDDSLNLAGTWAPRFMNSDISYFGVGGKQAVFFIGNATRMISKPKDSTDVHEMVISKEEFEKREKNNQSIYSGFIRNRKPGDSSHIAPDDENLIKLISEEPGRESFTAVVIQGVSTQHIAYLKQNFNMWTRQLAHIYHFYLHGPDGNKLTDGVNDKKEFDPFNNIDIQVNVFTRGSTSPKSIDLRKIDDDMQSQYVRTSASTFDFKAYVDGSTAVEGVIRYHPFKYDRETYPADIYGIRLEAEPEDDHGYAINERPARGRRPMFEAYWNGRLIPYTLIEEFDWCSSPKKQKTVPSECYNRISGVLWTNDSFQVSTNKLTFLDLEMKLKDKNTNFVRIFNGHEKRTNIEKEFLSWLRECNEEYDKQILFSGNQGQIARVDLPKQKQIPWTKFTQVEWDGKVYQTGQMVRILRTAPALYGTIQSFYLYGEYEGDVYAMGGDIELLQEPQSLYTERKFVPLNKLDRGTSALQIKKYIDEEEAKLPDHLIVSWPNGMEIVPNEKRNAGKTIGDIKVEISNKKGEKISKIPVSAGTKKLLVELKLIWHAPHGDEVIVALLSQHGKTWPYWFRKMDSAKNLGNYTLQLNTVLNESGNVMFAGRELPSHIIKFTVCEGDPEKFTVGILDGPFKVGVPFQIPLEFQDRYNNSTRPPAKLKPILDADGLELSYENTQVKGNSCFIKGVVAKGIVNSSAGKNFNLKVSIPGLDQSHTLKIRLLPGPVASLVVKPETEVTIENGSAPTFFVEVLDAAGNITSGGKIFVIAKLTGANNLPNLIADCSANGTATLTGRPVLIKNMTGEKLIKAEFDVQGVRNMQPIERTIRVLPSNRASLIKMFHKVNGTDKEIKNGDTLQLEAGSILDTLRFEIYNEAEEEIEIDDKVAGKIKVNWAPRLTKDMIQGKTLPPLKASTSTLETKYCQISLMEGDGIELQFSIKSTPGPAHQMDCQLIGETITMLNQPLNGSIHISLKDKFGNPVAALASMRKNLVVSGSSLKTDLIKVTVVSQQLEVHNLVFTSMGSQEVELAWNSLKGYVRCEVLSGPPTQLQVLDWVLEEPYLIHSGKPMDQPFRVQILDSEKNVCKLSNIRVNLVKDQKLKVQPATSFVKTDESGVANFGVLTFTANSGSYEIQPNATIDKTTITGPKLTVNVQPDPLKPTQIDVSYNAKVPVIAGHTFPDFIITVKSEDGGLLRTASADQITMRLLRKEVNSTGPSPAKTEILQVQNGTKEDTGTFSFKKCQVPEVTGDYIITFTFYDGIYELISKAINMTVTPGSPASLIPLDRRTTPTVSNTKSLASRTLVKSLRLELRDEYDNPLGKDYNGKVLVEISAPSKVDEVPVFATGQLVIEFPLLNGQCTLQNLTLQENTSGKDGFEYHLHCTVVCDMIPKNKPLPPLDIPFLFYNDAKKQQQMAALSKERDNLQNTIRAYKSMFETQQQLIAELRDVVHETQKEEQTLRGDLRKQNIPSNQLQSVETVDKLISARIKEREQVLKAPRRTCALLHADSDGDVLGKIAHLALVHQDDIARVLSWHMSADMDCVVTLTTQKAKEIYQRTQGKQQVLPLDSIYRKNLPEWDKPLPHVRYNSSYRPAGNPIYARNLLEFTKDEESCKVVFGMLLGDTLILDNLDHANLYRQEIIKYTHCPTILTISGDRIRSNGKFGGAMNKAPPMDKLKGSVFGQPLPIAYHALCTQIETLEKYKNALLTSIQSQDELQEQINLQKVPETMEKYRECKEAETRLKEVERKLGMGSPTKGGKQPARSQAETEPALKKPKLEPGTSTSRLPMATSSPRSRNGPSPTIPDPSTTPSRTSSRIASMTTVVSEDGRKRLKKSV